VIDAARALEEVQEGIRAQVEARLRL